MNIDNNLEVSKQKKMEILLRKFLRCKVDYLNSASGFLIKIKCYKDSINEIIIFLINECNYENIIDVTEYLNKIEAFYINIFGPYGILKEKNTTRKLQKLIKNKQLMNVKITNNKIVKL